MPVHVINEANRCLQCKNPRCRMLGCPIQTNIPEVVRLFKENRMMEAAEILFENNPLSVVCSLVCNHENQCEGHCVRGIKGEPVHFSSIENYISDSCFERLDLSCAPSNGMKVGVVGAGPAGITIAIILARRGYKVTVFETREKIGGILRYGIPEFRLPKSILDRYYRRMRDMGILFRPNFELGDGSKDVTVYVRGDKVAASENEYNYAVLDGVHFEFKKNIVRIVDEGAVFCDRVEDPETGKLVDDHSTDTLVEADSVMISISQVPRDRLVSKDHDLLDAYMQEKFGNKSAE